MSARFLFLVRARGDGPHSATAVRHFARALQLAATDLERRFLARRLSEL